VRARPIVVLILLLVGAGPARAELLEVRQVASGMECPECARALQLRVKSLPGVDAVETSWNRRLLTLRLRRGNHATLTEIRSLVVAEHFQIREAEIVVAGQLLVDAAGNPALLVPESGLTYRIDIEGPAKPRWRRALADAAGTEVVITGRVPAAPLAADPLVLWPVDLRARPPGG
jgi:copper chaperone CopZ